VLPHDLPPYLVVYQQKRRWMAVGCFEAIVHDCASSCDALSPSCEQPTSSMKGPRMTTPNSPSDRAQRLDDEMADAFLSLKRGGTELYLIRHADALPGAEEVVAGGYDDQALSELGRRQAEALAVRMAAVPPTAIYSSPIGRAVQTARPTAERLGLAIQTEQDLREVELGTIGPLELESATPHEVSEAIRLRLREIALIAVGRGGWSSIPGAEPSERLRARTSAALLRIAAAHPGQRVMVVSHAGVINAALAALLGIPQDYFFPTANTSISVLRIKGERRLIFSLNDIAHLVQAGLWKPGE
jgi:broad specificity phosphatase PhoE